jgi:hypothetical protein
MRGAVSPVPHMSSLLDVLLSTRATLTIQPTSKYSLEFVSDRMSQEGTMGSLG